MTNHHISAAPAPEGGAVSKACADFQEAIDDFEADVADAMVEGSERADLWDREITVNIDALKTVMIAALATRHEAPAEAGEIGAEYDDAAHCVTLAACPPGLFLWNGTLGFKSEYGAMEPVGISPHHQQWKVGNRVDAYCADSGEYFWGGTSNHDDRAKLLVYPISAEAVAMVASHGLSALRAQPQAREDAQPVAGAKALAFFKWARDFFWREEGCEIDGGDFQDAAERFGLIVQVPFDPERHADNGYGLEAGDDWYETEPAVDQALAALQAEQGAK